MLPEKTDGRLLQDDLDDEDGEVGEVGNHEEDGEEEGKGVRRPPWSRRH